MALVVFRLYLHGVEHAVALLFGSGGEDDLAIGGDFEVHVVVGMVAESETADFGAAVFEHGYLCLRDDAVVLAAVFQLVAGKGDVVAHGHDVQRGVGGAPEAVGAQVADVEVCAVMVGGYLAVAVEEDVLVARESTATVVHEDCVFAVADDADFRHIGYRIVVTRVALGLHFAVLIAFVLRHLEVYVGLHLRFLLEEGLHRTHGGVGHEVGLQAVAAEVVGQRGQDHALVVGVVCPYGYMVFVVIAFVEPVLVVHLQPFEELEVLVYRAVVDTCGQHRAVGRDDDAVGRGVLELEVGDTKGMVLVVLGVVQLVVGRFGYTPGERGLDEGALGTYGEAVGFVHEGVLVGGKENQRHEVFEHRSVPRGHAFVSFVLHEGLVEAEPVFVGGVALGDGEEGGQAGLGGEVVVVVGEEGVGAVVVADAEDVEFGIVKLGEVGLEDECVHASHEPFPLPTFHFPLSTFHSPLSTFHFPLSTFHSPLSTFHFPLSTPHSPLSTLQPSLYDVEAGHEVAAVGGADEEVGEFGQGVDVVPVVEVSVPFLQPFHRADDVLQATEGFFMRDEPKL